MLDWTDDSVLERLARHGDLTLVRSRITGNVGILRDKYGRQACVPCAAFDAAEWKWVLACAAPLALSVLSRKDSPTTVDTS
jgi:hypothetical protein